MVEVVGVESCEAVDSPEIISHVTRLSASRPKNKTK
jgi:hypothetical protein